MCVRLMFACPCYLLLDVNTLPLSRSAATLVHAVAMSATSAMAQANTVSNITITSTGGIMRSNL